MGTLKKFVDTYLANKKIEDYEGWVSVHGKDAEGDYQKAIAAADRGYAADLATYGSRADRLLSRGLTGSGYSDYLSGKAMESYAAARGNALTAKKAAEKENREGYARYLANAEAQNAKEAKEAKDIYKNAVTSLFSHEFADEETAVAYLTAFGIDEKTARGLAKVRPLPTVKGEAGQAEVLGYCISYYLTPEQAYLYARGCGLSEENARAVAEAAKALVPTYNN